MTDQLALAGTRPTQGMTPASTGPLPASRPGQAAPPGNDFALQLRDRIDALRSLERSISTSAQAVASRAPDAVDQAQRGLVQAEEALKLLGSLTSHRPR